jgi:DNA-directed RNA polymerase
LVRELFKEQQSSDLSVLLNNIKNIESIKLSKDKISKWDTGNNSLLESIDKIFQSNTSKKGKQIALEKAIFEYDTNFFIKNLHIVSNEIKIFSQEYSNISRNYANLINDYTKYRSIKLKKLFNRDKTNAIIILMLIYTNKDKNISLILKFILDIILFNKQSLDGINKTVLLFKLAKYFTKIFVLSKEDNEINVFESVKNVCSYSDLKDLIKKLDENALLKLGGTLYSLVVENSKLIETELRTISKISKESIVKINHIYLNKLISSNISLSLLPMVSKPKEVDINGEYYPFLLNNTNVLGLEECKVIKGKYDKKYNTIGSKEFYEGINSMNKIKFQINNEMLKFVISEWSCKESLFFKGYNLLKEIYENDSKEIKKDKVKHNAVYSLYYNIIQIAFLFRNQTFYLPVYADFRGRIYTLSNYLSYQGNDLARSLLLFDTEEYLSSEGLNFLRLYFSNLAGFDKLSWKDRLNKSEELWINYYYAIIDYLEFNSKEKIDKFLSNVSEPFQLHSIGLAIHNYEDSKDREKFIIRNPILFDASCSGIQHISALTLDKNLASYSNVFTEKLNPSAEIPEDFYMYALGLINDKLLNSDNPNIKNIKLKRNTIKKTVMTIPYNISLTGIGEQLEEHIKKIWKLNNYEFIIPAELALNGISFSITSKEFGIFTKIIYEVLTKDIPSLKTLTNYFKNIINILNTLNLPINWETPAGLNINYQQIKFNSKVITNNLIQESKAITIAIPTDKIDKVKMLRSFMPNFIHSLDASNVHLLINYLSTEYNISFYTIHDCFASTPNNMGILENTVKKAFIDIYFKDEGYLLKAHKKFIQEIKDNFEIKIINNKEYVKFVSSTKEKEYIELPQFPNEFKNNKLKDFVKGLLQSKYFIG